ncbi:hypothetical protein HanXRQr2_Chr03g0119911 [Helianthus annuus]|uniref:Uncharacterized protein n=1 Tax=Helianthus annuus TaxID=4232 RepID=A0A9K3JIH1_HELAN|nr:hypothetical protein HanXRQr2_Chr03g0119911 [Helianthus annuus]KAJ0944410.1 hypothetical protein HanPSC8_Chr03g0116431 [Helianthus annuus]
MFLVDLQTGHIWTEEAHTVQRQRCLQGSNNTHASPFPQLLHNLLLFTLLSPLSCSTNMRSSSLLLSQHDCASSATTTTAASSSPPTVVLLRL